MTRLRLIMMGTGSFALPTFLALYDLPHQVAALVTQPERTGAGHHRRSNNPLKQLAQQRGTTILQPQNVNDAGFVAALRELAPDLLVVAAYGQILSPELLSVPRLGGINVHASLLPKYRGASPVAHAIWNGDNQTGVCIIQMLPQLDAGPILASARVDIAPDDTTGTLEDRLARLAPGLIGPVIEQLAEGTIEPLPQNPALASRAPKLRKEQGAIDWSQPASRVDCQVRAMQPWPGAFTWFVSRHRPPLRLLVLRVKPRPEMTGVPPGTLHAPPAGPIAVGCGAGAVELVQVQPEGKRPMPAAEFACGYRPRTGDRFDARPAGAAAPNCQPG